MKQSLIEIIEDAMINQSQFLFIQFDDDSMIVYTFDNFNQLLNDINSFYNDDLLMNDSDVYIISAIAVDDGTYTLDQVMHGLEINNFRK